MKNGLIVRSEGFFYHQNIGNVVSEAKRYNDWDVDELIYIDISREKHYDLRRDDHRLTMENDLLGIIEQISKVCFMPLTLGGGIRSLEDIRQRITRGADKITVNAIALEDPSFIEKSSAIFGAQCIVVSIDYKYINEKPKVFKGGLIETNLDPLVWAQEVERRGAGEIFLNSIDRDGMANGYDVDYIGKVVDAVNIPVIACGGAGDFYDFVDLAKATDVSAIAAGNIFHFTEHSYPRAKEVLAKEKIFVRY